MVTVDSDGLHYSHSFAGSFPLYILLELRKRAVGVLQVFLYTFPKAFVSKDVERKERHFHTKGRNVYFKNTQVPSYNIGCWFPDCHSFFTQKMNGNFKRIHSEVNHLA